MNSIERPHRIVVEALGEDDQDSSGTSNDSSLSLDPVVNAYLFAHQSNRLGSEAAHIGISGQIPYPYAANPLLTTAAFCKYLHFWQYLNPIFSNSSRRSNCTNADQQVSDSGFTIFLTLSPLAATTKHSHSHSLSLRCCC